MAVNSWMRVPNLEICWGKVAYAVGAVLVRDSLCLLLSFLVYSLNFLQFIQGEIEVLPIEVLTESFQSLANANSNGWGGIAWEGMGLGVVAGVVGSSVV